jgi:hypothetical protein
VCVQRYRNDVVSMANLSQTSSRTADLPGVCNHTKPTSPTIAEPKAKMLNHSPSAFNLSAATLEYLLQEFNISQAEAQQCADLGYRIPLTPAQLQVNQTYEIIRTIIFVLSGMFLGFLAAWMYWEWWVENQIDEMIPLRELEFEIAFQKFCADNGSQLEYEKDYRLWQSVVDVKEIV